VVGLGHFFSFLSPFYLYLYKVTWFHCYSVFQKA
jgi:hypothetical protein